MTMLLDIADAEIKALAKQLAKFGINARGWAERGSHLLSDNANPPSVWGIMADVVFIRIEIGYINSSITLNATIQPFMLAIPEETARRAIRYKIKRDIAYRIIDEVYPE